MTFAFQMKGNNPVGVWSGKPPVPALTFECTQADVDQFTSGGGAYFPGSSDPRWRFVAGVLAPLSDARRLVTWGHAPGVGVEDANGDWTFDLEVGDPEPVVTASLQGSATRTDVVDLTPSGHRVALKFVGGVVSLNIKTDKPTQYVIRNAGTIRFANKLKVTVRAVDLYAI